MRMTLKNYCIREHVRELLFRFFHPHRFPLSVSRKIILEAMMRVFRNISSVSLRYWVNEKNIVTLWDLHNWGKGGRKISWIFPRWAMKSRWERISIKTQCETRNLKRAPHEDEIANNDKRGIIQVAAFKSIFSCRLNARLDISIWIQCNIVSGTLIIRNLDC